MNEVDNMILMMIGLVIIFTLVGFFTGRIIYQDGDNFIKNWIDDIREKKRLKKERKRERERKIHEAKMKLYDNMSDELKKELINEEKSKFKDSNKSKLKKFAEFFSMEDSDIGSTDKINRMLGNNKSDENNMFNDKWDMDDKIFGKNQKEGRGEQNE